MQNSTNTPFKYSYNRERTTFGEKKTKKLLNQILVFFHILFATAKCTQHCIVSRTLKKNNSLQCSPFRNLMVVLVYLKKI